MLCKEESGNPEGPEFRRAEVFRALHCRGLFGEACAPARMGGLEGRDAY